MRAAHAPEREIEINQRMIQYKRKEADKIWNYLDELSKDEEIANIPHRMEKRWDAENAEWIWLPVDQEEEQYYQELIASWQESPSGNGFDGTRDGVDLSGLLKESSEMQEEKSTSESTGLGSVYRGLRGEKDE